MAAQFAVVAAANRDGSRSGEAFTKESFTFSEALLSLPFGFVSNEELQFSPGSGWFALSHRLRVCFHAHEYNLGLWCGCANAPLPGCLGYANRFCLRG